jgi:hypothetical protein
VLILAVWEASTWPLMLLLPGSLVKGTAVVTTTAVSVFCVAVALFSLEEQAANRINPDRNKLAFGVRICIVICIKNYLLTDEVKNCK